jgi:hypothetical protein
MVWFKLVLTALVDGVWLGFIIRTLRIVIGHHAVLIDAWIGVVVIFTNNL